VVLFFQVLIGIVLAAVFILLARTVARRGEMSVYALGLVVAALIYVGFALANGGAKDLRLEAWGLFSFSVAAFVSWRAWPMGLALAWAAHAAWDVLFHPIGQSSHAPDWYPLVCVGFDLAVAGYIFLSLRRRAA
jgi:hypothetical protein